MFVDTNFERCRYFVCISVCCLCICFLRKAIGKNNGAICALQRPCSYGNLIGIYINVCSNSNEHIINYVVILYVDTTLCQCKMMV